MARVSKAALAAKAAQTVNVQGVAAGSANITVAAKTDPTKKATVKITVVDGSVTTSSVSGLVVEGTAEITATVSGLGTGYTVDWFVEPDTGDDGYVTVAKDGTDPLKATITGVKEGGGRVGAKVTYKGLEFSDSSRVSCDPKPAPSE
ncbi:hypothetical protein ECO319P1_00101 [Escherichia phage ECO319P1]|nr:hypothetical protein ECO319P1_00101 [Escherichia phage ECO319P1]